MSESRRRFLGRTFLAAAGFGLAPAIWAQRQRTSTPLFYPLHAIQAGFEGTASVYAEIARGGYAEVSRIEKSSGQTILDQAALGAVNLWVFKENLPKAKRKVIIPLEFKLTDDTRRDLPPRDPEGKFQKRMAAVFYPFRAIERRLFGTYGVLMELSADGFAEKVAAEKPARSEVLNHCAVLFSLISSFGAEAAGSEGKPRQAFMKWEFDNR